MTDLPAYLQTRSTPKIATKAAEGIGGSLPPHISIRSNRFTLIDAAGNKQPMQELFLDGCFVDVRDVMCKQYYADANWTPDSSDPPTCWSANGIAPSRDAGSDPTCGPTCAVCQWNVRGSDQSMEGKPTKACRDEKWTAFQPVKYSTMLFQLKITPGSFKTWSAYVKKFEGQTTDLSDVVTRVSFLPDGNGKLVFEAISYINETMYKNREAMLAEKKTDILVGRNDRPKQVALAAPLVNTNLADSQFGAMVQSVPLPPPASAGSSFGQTASAPFAAPPAASTAPQEQALQQRRKRRTAAEIAADNAAKANPVPQGSSTPLVAPFRPAAEQPAPFAPSPPAQGSFGIAPGVAPNAELQATLNSVFGKQ